MDYHIDCFPNQGSHQVLSRVINRNPRVMDSSKCLPLTEKACRSTTPSNKSLLGEVFIPTHVRKASQRPALCDHRHWVLGKDLRVTDFLDYLPLMSIYLPDDNSIKKR